MIVISINSLSQLKLFECLCKRIKDRYADIIFVAFGCNDAQIESIKTSAQKLGINFAIQQTGTLSSENVKTEQNFPPMTWFEKVLYRFKPEEYMHLTNELFLRKQIYLDEITANLNAAQKIIERYKPDLVLVAEDGISGNVYLIQEARKQKITIIDIPYEASGKEDFVNLINEKIEEKNIIKCDANASHFHHYIHKKLKKWIITSSEGDLLLFPPELIIARLEMKLDLPDPWTTHGGNASILAVESKAMLNHYKKERIDPTKLNLVGSVYCDALYDSLYSAQSYQDAYERKTKINAGQTSILVSLPPSYHHSRREKNEFPSYKEMIEQLMSILVSKGLVISVSLHPAIPPEEVALIKSFNVNIVDDWVINLIPKHDIFFVTSFSSTIRWALACGKPTINYDAYNHNLKIYDGASGLYNSQQLHDIDRHLNHLLDDRQYQALAVQLAKERDEWGIIDGKNTVRLCQIFDKYISNC
ncbi:hypothetical protein OQJ35_04390 [Legionella pneumophila]|uniref:hypothetical protein n=1 Tax=Legionella pneumophila TaxID=446 RepID=UPI000776B7E0|nr:hypothetical protein [Legionella pneumophila]MCW8427764.1 hypothetical protein [Legionella pneumophila]HAT6809169.1 hypothetical protein [Legionella pneumophila]HAT8670086.1 hypothetical protein [Legionella pneumophila]HBD7055246.1 hypothetical protein [Legionella pneumophila]HBD7474089.1 hypothetical protein [Legionella pneumophila]